MTDTKTELRWYLQSARDALLWKLEGLSEYDARRPVSGYLGDSLGRPSGLTLPWLGYTEPGTDMRVTHEQSRASIVGSYRQAWDLADASLNDLPLDTVGAVQWWPADDNAITLHHALVRVISDTQRHAGHADILRELIDGAVGMNEDNASLPTNDPTSTPRRARSEVFNSTSRTSMRYTRSCGDEVST